MSLTQNRIGRRPEQASHDFLMIQIQGRNHDPFSFDELMARTLGR